MTTARNPKRAALYVRVSTAGQKVDMQLDGLRQLAAQRGWVIVDTYIDHGVSGMTSRRPELDRMMADARTGAIDVITVWALDRFARSLRHLINAVHEFEALGVDFSSVREALDTTTPGGRLTFAIFGALAQFEREVIVSRVRCGLEAARRRGVVLGRPRALVDADDARELHASGLSMAAVAEVFGVSTSTISRTLKRTQSRGANTLASESQEPASINEH